MLSPDEFYNLTPREFNNKVTGYEQMIEQNDRLEWIRMRMLATTLLQPHLKKGSKLTPEKLMPFHWEKKKVVKKMSKAQMKYIQEKYKKINATKSNKYNSRNGHKEFPDGNEKSPNSAKKSR